MAHDTNKKRRRIKLYIEPGLFGEWARISQQNRIYLDNKTQGFLSEKGEILLQNMIITLLEKQKKQFKEIQEENIKLDAQVVDLKWVIRQLVSKIKQLK